MRVHETAVFDDGTYNYPSLLIARDGILNRSRYHTDSLDLNKDCIPADTGAYIRFNPNYVINSDSYPKYFFYITEENPWFNINIIPQQSVKGAFYRTVTPAVENILETLYYLESEYFKKLVYSFYEGR